MGAEISQECDHLANEGSSQRPSAGKLGPEVEEIEHWRLASECVVKSYVPLLF
jgi:hypothetical protein